jgi:hypothetical protein
VTVLLGSAWTIAFVFACWRLVRSPRPRPFSALVILAAVVLTPEILSVLVNLPYKGVSSSEFLDAFLFPGGITPGGNGTLQSVLMAAASAGIAAVQLAHVVARSRRRTVVA